MHPPSGTVVVDDEVDQVVDVEVEVDEVDDDVVLDDDVVGAVVVVDEDEDVVGMRDDEDEDEDDELDVVSVDVPSAEMDDDDTAADTVPATVKADTSANLARRRRPDPFMCTPTLRPDLRLLVPSTVVRIPSRKT